MYALLRVQTCRCSIVMARRFMDDLDGLVESVLETGKEQVTKYEFKQVVQEESEDGI